MQFTQELKRMGVSFAITVALVALCATYSARSHHGYGRPTDANRARMHRVNGAATRPGPPHGEHPVP